MWYNILKKGAFVMIVSHEFDKFTNTLIINFRNAVTNKCSNEISAFIQKQVREYSPKRLVIDMKDLKFIDTAGMGCIMSAFLKAQETNCDFVIRHIPDRIKTMLHLSGVSSVRDINFCV